MVCLARALLSSDADLPLTGETVFSTNNQLPGADPGILVRGGVDFFFKGMELGAVLRPRWVQGAQGAKPPEAPEF